MVLGIIPNTKFVYSLISFQRKIFPSQDKSPAISGIITGHQIMKSKINR